VREGEEGGREELADNVLTCLTYILQRRRSLHSDIYPSLPPSLPSSVLFDDLWIRPTGRWLYPVHSFFPEVNDLTKQVVTYGTHVDAR